jgi:hypothetical protein
VIRHGSLLRQSCREHRTAIRADASATDHVDGQVEEAYAIMEETWPGVADAADTGDLGAGDLEIATVIRDWLRELTGDYEA